MPSRPNRPAGDRSAKFPLIPDRGCEYHRPSCFSCPFRDCVLAMTQVERKRELVRVSDIRTMARFNQLVDQGLDSAGAAIQISACDGVRVRTIFRRVERARARATRGMFSEAGVGTPRSAIGAIILEGVHPDPLAQSGQDQNLT